MLNYYGFSIVATPEALKIVKSADAKGMAVETLDKAKFMELSPEERIATLVYPLEYLDSNTMVGILRPLMSARRVSRERALRKLPADDRHRCQSAAAQDVDGPGRRARIEAAFGHRGLQRAAHERGGSGQGAAGASRRGEEGADAQGQDLVTSYPATNSLLISAPPEDMKEIRRIVEEIDTYRPQVLVEAAIVELSVSNSQTIGVEWRTGGRRERVQSTWGQHYRFNRASAPGSCARLRPRRREHHEYHHHHYYQYCGKRPRRA